ncbi:MAG: DapH/DapD/GlmU-related protein [Candidatus Helarchaeota archaeon]
MIIDYWLRYMDLENQYPKIVFYGPCSIKPNVKIGEGTRIGEFTVIGENAIIGKNCRILYHVTICKDAVIGDNVFIGPNTSLLNDRYPPSKKSEPPIIEDDVVIGGGCLIFPSVHIGRGARIGAGVRVRCDVPAGVSWLREKFEYEKL